MRSQKGEGEADFYAHIGNTLQCKYRQNITCQCNGNQHVGPTQVQKHEHGYIKIMQAVIMVLEMITTKELCIKFK